MPKFYRNYSQTEHLLNIQQNLIAVPAVGSTSAGQIGQMRPGHAGPADGHGDSRHFANFQATVDDQI